MGRRSNWTIGIRFVVCLFFQELESGQSDAGSGTLLECVNLVSSPSSFPAMRLFLRFPHHFNFTLA